ncbi:hypothetical protein B9G69_010770 [Bdellovibrio sp. SKB1291214]|uniref:DUF6635 family protein n=1 Tax=Bdellovibrio sp. SKB1291214 TaxID=1732569 RepID=UPI000B51B071|nr:DUF6635 family protein [Bdellovibrio sp. SKB1291214]UYL07527.1 hypothetical protein B9G69_010770 [Bdellovibrio sp. SKB1291214]
MDKNIILGTIDETLEEHFANKKEEVTGFVHRHFGLQEALKIQKQSLALDLVYYPLNTLWSVPYLTLKKVAETLDKLGWGRANKLVKHIPASFKTRYQKSAERILLTELLNSSQADVFASLEAKLHLRRYFSGAEFEDLQRKVSAVYTEEVDKFSSAQVLVTDLIATFLTVCAGKLFFHNSSLGVAGMGSKIARKFANDDAAERFFLGKKAGSAFYSVFPVAPTQTQIYMATIGIGLLLTVMSIAVAAFSDPVRKSLGIQDYKLRGLLTSLEQNLYQLFKEEIKSKVKRETFKTAA